MRPRIEERDRFLFATTAIDRFELYEPWHRLEKLTSAEGEEMFALGHAGHGMNSYVLGYILTFRGFSLLVYSAWGGIYQDKQAAAARCALRFEKFTPIVEAIESRADSAQRRSAICIADFLGVCAMGPLPSVAPEGRAASRGWVREHARESEYDAIEAMLESVLA